MGMGETADEVLETMGDLREVDCDLLTIGQYLRPSQKHLPIDRFYTPAEFNELREAGVAMGFKHVASGPLVRSSYHAGEQHDAAYAGGADKGRRLQSIVWTGLQDLHQVQQPPT